MDLLKYSDTVLHVCLAGKDRREVYDTLRQVYVYPQRIRICPCGGLSPWVRKTLEFLSAVYDNEPSHRSDGSAPNREFSVGTKEPTGGTDEHVL